MRARRNGDVVRLEVEDTGIGMDPGEADEAFTAIKQASEDLNRKYEGCGLSLPIVQQLVDQMDGTVELATEKAHASRCGCRRRIAPAPESPAG